MTTTGNRKNSIGIMDSIRYAIHNRQGMQNTKKLEEVRTLLGRANLLIGKMDTASPNYFQRVDELNYGLITLQRGKWAAGVAARGSSAEWKNAFKYYDESKSFSEALLNRLKEGSSAPIPFSHYSLIQNGTEIWFANETPLVPEINPVILLQGTDFELGYQYAQQLIDIFGKWILERESRQKFSPQELLVLSMWEEQMRMYAPEILEMCRGWAAGATDAGVDMTYEQVLDLWTGHLPPAETYMGMECGLPEMHPVACTGNAAWGRATSDGKLVTGSSGDHDCSFMATIVVFPVTGNPFIYTPFAVTGDLGKVGPIFMMGHPGMNNQGLAYVHHGGAPKMITSPEEWGYGLRLGTSVMHILRFANSAREAQEMELSFPAGDVGHISGVGGVTGFFADGEYGYVMESNRSPVLIREAGLLGETDFLYANNSVIHPDVNQYGWMKEDNSNWAWDAHGGWCRKGYKLDRSLKGSMNDFHLKLLGGIYQSSVPRNQYAYAALQGGLGRIDLDFMKRMYRSSGIIPEGSWDTLVKNYALKGEWGTVSVGHASNAIVVVTKPDRGDRGIYEVCVGEARRGLSPMYPSGFTPIAYETNTFWRLQLRNSPEEVTTSARQTALDQISQAQGDVGSLHTGAETVRKKSMAWLKEAEREYEVGEKMLVEISKDYRTRIYRLSRACRAFTRAQVYAQRVSDLITPPPHLLDAALD